MTARSRPPRGSRIAAWTVTLPLACVAALLASPCHAQGSGKGAPEKRPAQPVSGQRAREAELLSMAENRKLTYAERTEALLRYARLPLVSVAEPGQVSVLLRLLREGTPSQAAASPEVWSEYRAAALGALTRDMVGRDARTPVAAAEPVVRAVLKEAANDRSLGLVAVRCLVFLGRSTPADIAYLEDALNSPDGISRDNALLVLDALAAAGKSAHPALPTVRRFFQSGSGRVAVAAYTTLGRVLAAGAAGGNLPPAPTGISLTASDAARDGDALAERLWRVGQSKILAEGSLPQLLSLARGPHPVYVRVAAMDAIGTAGFGNNPLAVPYLLAAVSEENQEIVTAAGMALRRMRKTDRAAFPAVAAALRSSEYRTLKMAEFLIYNLGDAFRGQLPQMMADFRAMRGEEPNNWRTQIYLNTLGQLGSRNPQVGAFLLQMLKPGSFLLTDELFADYYEMRLLQLLNATDNVTADAIPALRRALHRRRGDTVSEAARAVMTLGKKAAPLLPDLQTILDDSDFDPMNLAGGDAEGHPEGSETAAINLRLTPRMQAIRAIGAIGLPACRAALPSLKRLSKPATPDIWRMEEAIQAVLTLQRLQTPLGGDSLVMSRARNVRGRKNSVPPFTFVDLAGKPYASSDPAAPLTVYIFASATCPSVVKYRDRVRELVRRYGPRGARFVYLFSDGQETREQVARFCKEQAIPAPAVFDGESQRLLKLLQGRCAMEVFVLDRSQRVRYHGRVDDNPFEPDQVRHRDLENAIRAILAKRPVAVAETQALGCHLNPPGTSRGIEKE